MGYGGRPDASEGSEELKPFKVNTVDADGSPMAVELMAVDKRDAIRRFESLLGDPFEPLQVVELKPDSPDGTELR